MMEEILHLQEQLAAVQQSSSAQRLSDRNVVELVMKLQSLNLVDLIFTKSGKQYLTPAQLSLEIQDEILAQGGRVNLTDLPEVLNVDLNHIQTKLADILEHDNTIRIVRGEILTDYYLTSVSEEIDDSLASSEDGVDNVGAIATRYALPVDIIRGVLTTHRDAMDASFDLTSGTLRSSMSIARDHAAARGALRAVTAPAILRDMAKQFNFEFSLLKGVAENMLAKREVSGVLNGSSNHTIFVPSAFSSAATASISSAFASNGFVLLERLDKLYISDVTQFSKANLQGGHVLKRCVIGPALLEGLQTAALEAIADGGWLDITTTLPPGFPSKDVSDVVERIALSFSEDVGGVPPSTESSETARRRGKKKAGGKTKREDYCSPYVFGNRFIVSSEITERSSAILCQDADEKAKDRAEAMTQAQNVTISTSGNTAKRQDSQTHEQGKKMKGKGRRRTGAKGKDAMKVAPVEGGLSDSFPVVIPSIEDCVTMLIADESISARLDSDYLASSGAGEEMIACVVERKYDEDGLRAMYEGKAAEAVVILERERALAKRMIEKELLEGLEHAHLFFKAATTLPEELAAISRAWINDSTCVDIVCRIADIVAQNLGVNHAGIQKAASLCSKKEKIQTVREVTDMLSPIIQGKVRSLIAVLCGKEACNVEEFFITYDENAELLDLPVRRPMDKKRERAAFTSLRGQMSLSLDQNPIIDEVDVLATAVTLAHARNSGGAVISFPSAHAEQFSLSVEADVKPAEASTAMRRLREALTLHLQAKETPGIPPIEPEFAEKLRVLRELIGC